MFASGMSLVQLSILLSRGALLLSALSTCVSAEVDRLWLALCAHGLLSRVPVVLPLVTDPVVEAEAPQSTRLPD